MGGGGRGGSSMTFGANSEGGHLRKHIIAIESVVEKVSLDNNIYII